MMHFFLLNNVSLTGALFSSLYFSHLHVFSFILIEQQTFKLFWILPAQLQMGLGIAGILKYNFYFSFSVNRLKPFQT